MSLLALSAVAVLVGAAVVAFLVMRFAMKVMWKLAMIGIAIVLLGVVAGTAYWWLGGGTDLAALGAPSAMVAGYLR